MTSRVRLRRDYPRSIATFAAALRDPGFHRARVEAGAGGEVIEHRVEGEGAGTRVVATVRQPVPTGRVPVALASLLSGVLVLERTERWTLGERLDGTVTVVVPRAPVGAEGSMSVTAVDGGCALVIDIAVGVHVPLAGAFMEPSVIEGIRALTALEHDQISTWLAAAG